ncbi:MAG: hypothetical protein AAF486_05870, partial [Pseudomonadota bacterium]
AGAAIGIEKGPAIRFIHLGQLLTVYYFAYFLVILPYLGLRERPKDEPDSIHKAVLAASHGSKSSSGAGAPVPAPAE